MEEEKRTKAKVLASGEAALEKVMKAANEITAVSDFRYAYEEQFRNLSIRVRMLRVLEPMIVELKQSREPILEEAVGGLVQLWNALDAARELLQFGIDGSKLFLVLERDKITKWFQEVIAQLQQALDAILFNKFDISDDVKEEVELVHIYSKWAKERVDMSDVDDIAFLYDMTSESYVDPEILGRLAVKLQLNTIFDLTQESLALHKMTVANGDSHQSIEKMSMLLKKIKDYVQMQNLEMGIPSYLNILFFDGKHQVSFIPINFRCPISFQLMRDPVCIATGQTYERACIKKWIDAGHDRCPKTQHKLVNTTLTPNLALRNVIAHWCEANGIIHYSVLPNQASHPCRSWIGIYPCR